VYYPLGGRRELNKNKRRERDGKSDREHEAGEEGGSETNEKHRRAGAGEKRRWSGKKKPMPTSGIEKLYQKSA